MFSKNLLIGHRIILGFSVPLVALLVIGTLSLSNLENLRRERAAVDHTIEVMNEVRLFGNSLSRVESAGRGYLLIGDALIKGDLELRQQRARESLDKLKELTVDNPLQQERLARIEPLLNRRHQLSTDLISVRDAGAGAEHPRVPGLIRDGQTTSDAIRTILEDMSMEETRLLAERRISSEQAMEGTRNTVVFGSAAAFLMVLVGGILLNRSITNPLAELRAAATRIGQGDYSHRASESRDDETGHLARVFNAMAVQVQDRQTAMAEQDWLKTNLAKFSALFERQRDPEQVCRSVLSELDTLLDAPQAVIYRAVPGGEGEVLELCASRATVQPPQHVKPGEGLLGQCFAERRRLLITDAPPDYLKIASALGGAKPAVVLCEPVVFEGRTKAVLEVAGFKPFSALQLQLVARLSDSLGVVLQTIEAAQRTEQLLEDSQALSAKLAEQQRVLAEKNLELEAHTDRLRKSEILLQEQQVELTQTNEELEQSNEELQQSNEEMEEKSNLLAAQKQELEKSNRAIEQARADVQEQARQLAVTSKYKSDFLATMSHELRTPLNSLLILARLLRENRDKNLSDKQVQYAHTIESSGADLLEMINQILDLAKIESGKVEVQVDEVAPVDIQRSIESQFRHVADTKKLGFEVTLADEVPPTLRTDVHRLQQVMKNLLSNAFKFTETGSVKVAIRKVTEGWRRRQASLDHAPAVVAFEVTDTGIGIAKEKQQVVFETFQQADAGTSRRFGGTGLGLSISREIATLLGGVLQLDSEPGEGSTFTLFIPATLDVATAQASAASIREERSSGAPSHTHAPAAASGRGSNASAEPTPAPADMPEDWDEAGVEDDRNQLQPNDRILLIIEDDDRFARILMEFAHDKRFKALIARSARKGLAMAQRFMPAAITLDLRLADEDGWIVLDRLKHDERTRHIPVHVISVDPARGRGLRMGAVSYLQKPVTKDAINDVLRQTVDLIERPVKSLLVIEDDAVQRQTICELIGNGDVHTTAVGSAKDALAELNIHRYDCIVIDLMLPDMPGVALIREINKRLGLQAPPVIVYTGKDLSQSEETELRSLSESIIVKDARSPERLLDETALFLHRVQARLPEPKRRMLESVRKQDAVLTGRRVLIVDDDVRNIFALTAALEGYGMIVKFAESGQGAIDSLHADPNVDIVLMDVMMPGMDGNETIRRLRQEARFVKLPMISVTAKAMKGDRERCIDAGASDYITKPVDTEKLLSLLRVWLYR